MGSPALRTVISAVVSAQSAIGDSRYEVATTTVSGTSMEAVSSTGVTHSSPPQDCPT